MAHQRQQQQMVCNDRLACNFNQPNQCNYDCYGCTDSRAINYDKFATLPCNGRSVSYTHLRAHET